MLLQHLETLAKTAYSGISSSPEDCSTNMVEEYSLELTADIQTIKKSADFFNQDPAVFINRYQTEYEMHLTVWLNALSRCISVTNAGSSEEAPPYIVNRNRRADNKFKRFREWRSKALKGVQRRLMPQKSPLTELENAKAKLEVREKKQRLMKKANAIIRSKKDVTPRLVELLSEGGEGGEEAAAKLQQPDHLDRTGFPPHQLNNNNANIFRLKRRIKDLERKIGLMPLDKEEVREKNGVKMVYNYAADRVQLFFAEKPVEVMLRQLKANGWHWSPSAGCWQRKQTESARQSAEIIYKTVGTNLAESSIQTSPIKPANKKEKRAAVIKMKSIEKMESIKEITIPQENKEVKKEEPLPEAERIPERDTEKIETVVATESTSEIESTPEIENIPEPDNTPEIVEREYTYEAYTD